jgi:hypothetical protein
MKKISLLLIILIITLAGVSNALYANEASFSFISVVGVGNMRPDSATDDAFKRIKAKDSLEVGQRVRLEPYSGAILDLAQGGTLVIKEETVAVLTNRIPTETKLNLLTGDLWLALKDSRCLGTFEIEMSQSSVKVRNGNITLTVSPDGLDNYVRVLSGEAEVTVKGRVGASVLRPGQWMVLKQRLADAMRNRPAHGIVDVFDIEDERARWEDDTARIGSELGIDELTKRINEYCDQIDKVGKGLLLQYERILAGSGTLSDVEALKGRLAEFQAVLSEANLYGRNAKMRLAMSDKQATEPKKKAKNEDEDEEVIELLDAYKKTSLQSAVARLDTMLSYFKTRMGKATLNVQEKSEPEKNIQKPMEALQPLEEKLEAAFAISLEIRREIYKGLGLKAQSWFAGAQETLADCANELLMVSALIAEEQILYPRDKQLPTLAKRAERYLAEVRELAKSLEVVRINEDTMFSMTDLQDRVAAYTSLIMNAVQEYRGAVGNDVLTKQKKRREYLRILNNYNGVQREYRRAERQYKTIQRQQRPTSYVTEELDRVSRLWREIEVDFMRLDEESGTLRQLINE